MSEKICPFMSLYTFGKIECQKEECMAWGVVKMMQIDSGTGGLLQDQEYGCKLIERR